MTRTILKRVAASALLSAATAPCFLALPAAAQSYTVLHSFDGSDGQTPHGLVQPGGGDRNFYGTTSSGGATNNGTVFMITPGGTLTTLHSFGEIWSDGAHPNAGVVFASDGNFYGTTSSGRSSGFGTRPQSPSSTRPATTRRILQSALGPSRLHPTFPN